jgi:hypothetical protein
MNDARFTYADDHFGPRVRDMKTGRWMGVDLVKDMASVIPIALWCQPPATEPTAALTSAPAEPIAWALKFPGDGGRLCLSTVFDTEEEAKEYASSCDSAEVVPLAPPQTPQAAGAIDARGQDDAVTLLRKYKKLCVEIGRGDGYHLDRIERAISSLASPEEAPPAAGAALAVAFKRWKISDKFRAMQQHPEGQYYAKDEVDAALAATPAPQEVTEAMVTVYLKTNDAYWKRTDELPATNPGKWRQGTPREATRESLKAALKAAHPGELKDEE